MLEPIIVDCPKNLQFLQPKLVADLYRLGNLSDGGYAMTQRSLLQADCFLSLGLGENWSFETAISIARSEATIDIYDDTVSLMFFVTKVIKGLGKFILRKDSFANLVSRFSRLRDYVSFWINSSKNKHHKIRINEQTFREIIAAYPAESKIGLKVDIEGSEWEILRPIAENCQKFKFILIEIHDFDTHERELKRFLSSLGSDFFVAHLHANNFEPIGSNGFPRVFELTLLNKTNAETYGVSRKQLPIPGLDAPNAKNRPDFQINFT
jgi:hypothetical protein